MAVIVARCLLWPRGGVRAVKGAAQRVFPAWPRFCRHLFSWHTQATMDFSLSSGINTYIWHYFLFPCLYWVVEELIPGCWRPNVSIKVICNLKVWSAVSFACAALGGEEEIKKEEASKDEISWPWSKKVGSKVGACTDPGRNTVSCLGRGLKVCFGVH